MPFRKSSKSSVNARDTRPSETGGALATAGEKSFSPERTDRDVQEPLPPQSSGNYPTNPTTEHRYGANIGTGVYDPDNAHTAHTTYTISEADFKRTAPDSGAGIHARQYHGPETGVIPVGTTTYVRDTSGTGREIDPSMHARIAGSELREGRYERGNVQSDIVEERAERTPGEPRLHDRDNQRERGMALGADQDRVAQEKVDTRKGSLHGVYGSGRHRDAAVVGRDTDATDFGNRTSGKLNAGRDQLSSSGSDRDKLIGTTRGRERLAKEQDSKLDTVRASQEGTRYPTSRTGGTEPTATAATGVPSGAAASTAYTVGNDTVPGIGMAGVGSGVHGPGPDTRTVYDKTGRTGASTVGNEGQRREAEAMRESSHINKSPTMMDKFVGKTEVAIGKSTGNASLLAKGEAKAAGLSRN